MKTYVLGFLFSPDLESVLLMQKNRPAWQAGHFNGIGGKIESGETPLDAMARECHEETGVLIAPWREFCVMGNDQWRVHCFYVQWLDPWNNGKPCPATTKTDEPVLWVKCSEIPNMLVIPNLTWLVPMALDAIQSFGLRATVQVDDPPLTEPQYYESKKIPHTTWCGCSTPKADPQTATDP